MMVDFFDADPDQIRAHSSQIADLAGRMDTANGAADETLDSNAFGHFGQFLAAACVMQGYLVRGMMGIGAGSVHLGKATLDATAATYEGIEQAAESLFGEKE